MHEQAQPPMAGERLPSSSGRPIWLFRVLATTLGLILAVSAAELLIRILHLYSADRLIAPHPHYGVMNIPGASGWFVRGEVKQFVTINRYGLRDDDFRFEPASATRRYLLLGDSFISAFQVPIEKTCQAVTEDLLTTATGCSTEIIAAACNGWGTSNELAYLEREGFDLCPDGIIIALFPENDLLDNIGPKPGPCPWPPPPYQSPSLFLPDFVRHRIGTSRVLRTWLRDHPRLMRRLTPSSYRTEKALARGLYHLYSTVETRIQKRMWDRQEELLIRLNAHAVERGIPLGVLVVPGSLAVNEDEIRGLQDQWRILRGANLDPRRPRSELKSLLTRLSIPSLDLLPVFKEKVAAGEILLFQREGHWTAAGNLVAAQYLSMFMQQKFGVASE